MSIIMEKSQVKAILKTSLGNVAMAYAILGFGEMLSYVEITTAGHLAGIFACYKFMATSNKYRGEFVYHFSIEKNDILNRYEQFSSLIMSFIIGTPIVTIIAIIYEFLSKNGWPTNWHVPMAYMAVMSIAMIYYRKTLTNSKN